jgi:uncharacterized protein YegP (UPF0339 family)
MKRKRDGNVWFFRDREGRWRWIARASNGHIVGDCNSDGYRRRIDCVRGSNSACHILLFGKRTFVGGKRHGT